VTKNVVKTHLDFGTGTQLFASKTSAAAVFVFHQKHRQLTAIFPAVLAKNRQ
jgi:hypothetical protein